ncbi:MAG: acyclic terpene utilization AtuA family protein [Roseovarius sp.]|uniref:acyclic terpene utilization AtuA family protein n=1 Tax=Roseovarius sp. TaxID=1486281 RepID=UPI0032EE988A
MNEFRMLSTSGILGYGFPEASLAAGLARKPHVIGVDGGSVDPGPHYLGSGKPFCSPGAIRRDLRLMLNAAISTGAKLVIGTCGGAGGAPHLELVAQMAREIAEEDGLAFKLALIHAEQSSESILGHVGSGKIAALGGVPDLSEDVVTGAVRIVGMMGPEPIMKALDEGAQVVLAGRASDPAPWAACAINAGFPPAPSWYAGKMLECGATPAIPKGHDCILVTVREDGVECEPANPARRCTPLSIANHSLHENASPIFHLEPGGLLDTSACTFEAVSDRTVVVRGMTWVAREYTVKLEAAELVGYRAFTVCGTRDPGLIGIIDTFLQTVRQNTADKSADLGILPTDYVLSIRVYGANGVMGSREPKRNSVGHELGFLVDVVASEQSVANAVLALARTQMLHTDFDGRLCREGNMAFPFSPSDQEGGAVYRFSMHHTLSLDDPCEIFPVEYEMVG